LGYQEYFVHGTDRVARVTAGSTTPLERIQTDEATFFLYDHLGNTRMAFKVDGSNIPQIVNAMDYSYGKILREFEFGTVMVFFILKMEIDITERVSNS
jgi:hypothetical protein